MGYVCAILFGFVPQLFGQPTQFSQVEFSSWIEFAFSEKKILERWKFLLFFVLTDIWIIIMIYYDNNNSVIDVLLTGFYILIVPQFLFMEHNDCYDLSTFGNFNFCLNLVLF